jgi:hypothetical protein
MSLWRLLQLSVLITSEPPCACTGLYKNNTLRVKMWERVKAQQRVVEVCQKTATFSKSKYLSKKKKNKSTVKSQRHRSGLTFKLDMWCKKKMLGLIAKSNSKKLFTSFLIYMIKDLGGKKFQ